MIGRGLPSTRERVLDAAERHAVAVGLSGLRIGRIAAEAGVSRQTVHNDFGDKRGLALALAVRIACRVLEVVDDELPRHAQLADAVSATMARTVRMAEEQPLIRRALTGAAGVDILPLLTTDSEPILRFARERIVELAVRQWPAFDHADVELAADIVVRVTISHIVCPTEPIEESARKLALLVAGYFVGRGVRS